MLASATPLFLFTDPTASDEKAYARRPMRSGGFLYATNLVVAVRIDDDRSILAAKCPNVISLFIDQMVSTAKAQAHLISTKAIENLPEQAPCPTCNGSKKLWRTVCPECTNGAFTHGSYSYDCQRCFASGKVDTSSPVDGVEPTECDDCGGLGMRHLALDLMPDDTWAAGTRQLNPAARTRIDAKHLWAVRNFLGTGQLSVSAPDKPAVYLATRGAALIQPVTAPI